MLFGWCQCTAAYSDVYTEDPFLEGHSCCFDAKPDCIPFHFGPVFLVMAELDFDRWTFYSLLFKINQSQGSEF
jgi:hypothetical protein